MSDPTSPFDETDLRARLRASRVAIIGCGGLGSNIAAMLVRSGVRTLTLADFDVVAETNLNRQLYFRDQLGMLKVEALAETLLRIDPDVTLRLVSDPVDAHNLVGVAGDADVITEAVDRADTKALIISTWASDLSRIPLVTASGLAGVDSANLIRTEPLAHGCWVVGDLSSDVRDGHALLASRVMVAAAHQAHAVIRLLLGFKDL